MTLPITVAVATILMVSLGILFLVRLLGSENPVLPVTTEWLSELSTDRYRPMLRLLDDADFEFLRSQKGFTAEMASSLRRQRVHAFRGYLRLLEADFARAAAALQVILAHSACDRPELAFLVFQRRLTFAVALMGIQFQLLLFRAGVSGADVSSLIRLFDSVRLELRTLVPASSPVAA
jgi:hypothetical protein